MARKGIAQASRMWRRVLLLGMEADSITRIDFVADIICPWCFIALRRLEGAIGTLAGEGLRLGWVWRPFLLYPAMPPRGVPQRQHLQRRFASMEAAHRYHDGVAEAGRGVGITFRYNSISRTPSSIDAHRLLLLAGPSGQQAALADQLATAFFTLGEDIGDRDVLVALAQRVGLDAAAARAALESRHDVETVLHSDRIAKAAGIGGAPAFCLHGRIIPARDDEDLADTLRAAHRALAPA